jgi:hypothetical protein
MAVLYVTEYVGLALVQTGGQLIQAPQEPPLVEQAIAITAGSTVTAVFNDKTTLVRVVTDAVCGVTFGITPTAAVQNGTLGSQRLAANQSQFHSVPKNSKMKVAVIATT